MKKIVTLTLIAAAMAVSACNTIAGVGRDVSAAGDAVTGASNEARN
ncbi:MULTISPECIES: entericidin A/B family lipoprotein [Brevundimonas]|jgi:predicted small secreted protein|nr:MULTISPECIES: entericidin A/B family lipoprotein [Brevundimonas]MBU1323905.1 entericidin A/B family lipoprotein [Alphaproteobacteria bacterium]MBU1526067.1 entericidin A/B family lipoprotein [Alphaproteobacteria bacterium]MBU2118045.1 entericidin A/B family lipoprotein [Alphaproteobacteria bacterium]MBU2350620.1 entericidin A/B family lipoprotein [Alphaproteobacteria bacterium]MBU2382240.1 entericidin A/B family lipoprotein [Alphaproteobacteria bacterium]